MNALDIAEKYGHKTCARSLFMFRWQQRAKNVKPSAKVPIFAHQLFDSSLSTHLRGPFQQMYMECIQPPGEFAGSGFGAKKRQSSRRVVEFEGGSDEFSLDGSSRKLCARAWPHYFSISLKFLRQNFLSSSFVSVFLFLLCFQEVYFVIYLLG